MTTPTSWTADHRGPTDAQARRLALIAGALFVATFVTAIAAVVLYQPLLDDPAGFLLGAGADTPIFAGATLELLLIVANIGTAIALFPILRRQSEGLALGYVAARIVECVFIAVGVVSLLAVVSLRQDVTADEGSLLAVGQSLVAIHDWTFLLGPGFVVGVGNGMLLGYLMYRSGLVPRGMAMLGLVGGPLVCISGIAVMFGAFEAGSAPQFLATVPEIAWEGSLGIYLLAKGFKASSPLVSNRRVAARRMGRRDSEGVPAT